MIGDEATQAIGGARHAEVSRAVKRVEPGAAQLLGVHDGVKPRRRNQEFGILVNARARSGESILAEELVGGPIPGFPSNDSGIPVQRGVALLSAGCSSRARQSRGLTVVRVAGPSRRDAVTGCAGLLDEAGDDLCGGG